MSSINIFIDVNRDVYVAMHRLGWCWWYVRVIKGLPEGSICKHGIVVDVVALTC